MSRFSSTYFGPSGLASIPLAVAYAAVPLGTAAARYTAGVTGTVSVLLPWLLLGCLGTVLAMVRPTPGAPKQRGIIFNLTLFAVIVATMVMYAHDIVYALSSYVPYLREASPLIFTLFCFLWAATCGLPDRADFQRFGALLGIICVVDLGAEIYLYQAVPTVRWIGNADMLAGLLLVSICAGLKPGENEGGVAEPDQGYAIWRALALLGLLACLSRTGYFAAGWVVLCFGRGGVLGRIGFALLCVGLLVLTFFLPTTPSDAIRFTDYWLWVETLRLVTANPAVMLTGFPIGTPLPFEFPAGMGPVWEAATGSPSMFGASLPQVPSFWLRTALGWGIGVPLALLTVLFVLLMRRLTRLGAGLVAALFAQGMSTPLLFDPAMAAVIGLGFILAMTRPANQPNARHERTVAEEVKPEAGVDPAEEWDLRPL